MNVFSLSWAAAGLALLGLSLFPAGSLALGGAPAHLAVFLLLLALAALALRLLRREGLDRPRLLDALLPIGLAFFLRALLLDYQSADYQMYLIKLFSILFDVVLAWGGFRLVRHFAPERPNRPLLCFCLLLLLPTVILNGAFWGQCDALYGALTLHALACALEGRNRSSLLLLGIAFSFKLQTVFVLPLWGGLWLLRRVRFRELLWFPAAYAATCVPALLLGKPLGDILGVYFGQAAEYSGYLNLNAPNMYALIPHGAEVNTALAARLGILAAFALAAAVLAALLVFRRQADDRALLAAAVVLAIGVPFLLPHMHERYFFLADVLALAWTCAFPRSAPCALLVELASLGAYVVVLRGKFTLAVSLDGRLFPMLCEALLMLAGLAFAVLSLARRLAFPQKSRE